MLFSYQSQKNKLTRNLKGTRNEQQTNIMSLMQRQPQQTVDQNHTKSSNSRETERRPVNVYDRVLYDYDRMVRDRNGVALVESQKQYGDQLKHKLVKSINQSPVQRILQDKYLVRNRNVMDIQNTSIISKSNEITQVTKTAIHNILIPITARMKQLGPKFRQNIYLIIERLKSMNLPYHQICKRKLFSWNPLLQSHIFNLCRQANYDYQIWTYLKLHPYQQHLRDPAGKIPLMWAVLRGNLSLVQLLVKQGIKGGVLVQLQYIQ